MPTTKFGTSDDKSDILERPRKAICSCVTTETASGVSIKFVSLFVAVTMISSTSAVSSSCAKIVFGAINNTKESIKSLLISMYSPNCE